MAVEKVLKEHIVSFRISTEKAKLIQEALEKQPIVGVKSVNHWFRKVGMDLLGNRLAYRRKEDAFVDSDL